MIGWMSWTHRQTKNQSWQVVWLVQIILVVLILIEHDRGVWEDSAYVRQASLTQFALNHSEALFEDGDILLSIDIYRSHFKGHIFTTVDLVFFFHFTSSRNWIWEMKEAKLRSTVRPLHKGTRTHFVYKALNVWRSPRCKLIKSIPISGEADKDAPFPSSRWWWWSCLRVKSLEDINSVLQIEARLTPLINWCASLKDPWK